MGTRLFRASFFGLCAVVSLSGGAVRADGLIDFTYISTRNRNFNNKAHLLNTGIFVEPGDRLDITGTGRILVGGPFSVLSNFDMGLISPIQSDELIRSYGPAGAAFRAAPIPQSGESVLFAQDLAWDDDRHDMDITVYAQSRGLVYIGMLDHEFGDNTGSHEFQIRHVSVPEPCSALLLGMAALWVRKRR